MQVKLVNRSRQIIINPLDLVQQLTFLCMIEKVPIPTKNSELLSESTDITQVKTTFSSKIDRRVFEQDTSSKTVSIPSLRELLRNYGVKQTDLSPNDTSFWKLPEGLAQAVIETSIHCAKVYIPRPLPAYNYDGDMSPPPDIATNLLKIYSHTLSCDPTLQLEVSEVAGISSMVTRDKKQWALWVQLRKDQDLIFDSFLLHSNTPEWNYSHRLTPAKYRGMGLFGIGSTFHEHFIQEIATKKGIAQCILVDSGQPDVLLSFLKRGYTPRTELDKDNLFKLLSNDSDFFLSPAMKPKVMQGGNMYDFVEASDTSNYCFSKKETKYLDQSALKIEKAIRIQLEKRFV